MTASHHLIVTKHFFACFHTNSFLFLSIVPVVSVLALDIFVQAEVTLYVPSKTTNQVLGLLYIDAVYTCLNLTS
jgi:hypothetical protein